MIFWIWYAIFIISNRAGVFIVSGIFIFLKQCLGSECFQRAMLTAGALTVMRSRMEWGSSRCGWRWVETWPIANCLVTCLRMHAMSLSLCGEALRRRPKRTGSGGSGRSLRGQKVGKAAWQRGCVCCLLRLWAAYMDCRQMSILMEVCQPLAICLLARPADAPSNFYHPVARFLFDGSWLSYQLEHGNLLSQWMTDSTSWVRF